MIIKIKNTDPRITFLTCNGNKTPKEIWQDEETGIRGATKRGVIAQKERWSRLGITKDMTDEEVMARVKQRLGKSS